MGSVVLVRAFAVLAAAMTLCAPALAQDRAKAPRVAVVFTRLPLTQLEGPEPRFAGARVLVRTLAGLGWKHGENIEIVWRSAQGRLDRHGPIMEELASMRVDVIAASGNEMIRAAMRQTRSIPIVMMASTSPVESGLVESLGNPGGNVTGLAPENHAALNGKRLALFKQAVPRLTRVAYFHDAEGTPMTGVNWDVQGAASRLGLAVLPYPVSTRRQLEAAIEDAVKRGANGLFVDTSLAAAEHAELNGLARQHRLPTLHAYPQALDSGGLLSYSVKWSEVYQRTAFFIHRILSGARVEDLPVEQPSGMELAVNLRAAKDLGLEIPASVITLADTVLR